MPRNKKSKKSKATVTTSQPASTIENPTEPTKDERPENMTVRNFFHRMKCVGQLIHKGFGLEKIQDADIITKNAYLVVVSRIIEALSREDELSTAELATLSKTLAEQRRLEIQDKEIERKFVKEERPTKTPARLNGSINQLYGTGDERDQRNKTLDAENQRSSNLSSHPGDRHGR